jgi:tungstate transport system substrate-binding protein
MRLTFSILSLSVVMLGPGRALAQFPTLRLAVVPAPDETGLLRELLPDFERESGYRVVVYSGEDVYDAARSGQADLVISHYGHSGVEAFMAQGLGLWPRAVFANQIGVIGPADDPARIRGLQDAGEALRRIALSGGSRFVSNNSSIMKYLESVLLEAAERPRKDTWFVDTGVSESDGMALAARMRAYYIFALPPFLRWKRDCLDSAQRGGGDRRLLRPIGARDRGTDPAPCDMDALLLAGPMPHRIMVSIVVNPGRVPAVNVSGASALQDYLLRPAVQARIERFRDSSSEHQLWKAAGLHNSAAGLGFGRRP